MPDGRNTPSNAARLVVCSALIVYCCAITTLALFPATGITWVSWVVLFLATIAVIGLIAHASTAIVLPGEQYAYLVTAVTGAITLLVYDWQGSVPVHERVRVSLFLTVGIIGGVGAYVAQRRGGSV